MIRALFSKSRLDGRLQDELQLHVSLLAVKNENFGMNHKEAWRQARIAVGGLDQSRECVHDACGFTRLSDLRRNFLYSFRRLLSTLP